MGKLPRMKKRGVSAHSRAARRATSPSLNLDRSPKTVADQEIESKLPKHHVLAAQSAGISRKRKQRELSRSQKARQRRGIERADVNADTLDAKVQKSIGRHKAIKSRRANWEELETKAGSDERQMKPDLVQSRDKANIFRNLDVEGEKKTSELPYAYVGAKMSLPMFSSRPVPPPKAVPPQEAAVAEVDEIS